MKLRSFMFLPAYNRRFIDKALLSDADAIILDLEDSVPKEMRQAARDNIIEYAEAGKLKNKTVYVRINPIEEDDFVLDMSTTVIPGITGIMPSKINDENDVIFIDRLLDFFERKNDMISGSIKMAPLIETVKAISNVEQIAKASNRLVAICLGGEDYLNDLGVIYTYQASALVYARAVVVNAARANKLLPIDTPYIDIRNLDGFAKAGNESYRNGFAGCLVLNPAQIQVANKAYSPAEDMVEHAKRITLEMNNNPGKNILMLDDEMIGPPMMKRAIGIMSQME